MAASEAFLAPEQLALGGHLTGDGLCSMPLPGFAWGSNRKVPGGWQLLIYRNITDPNAKKQHVAHSPISELCCHIAVRQPIPLYKASQWQAISPD